MKSSFNNSTLYVVVSIMLLWNASLIGQRTPNWEAYNDYRPSDLTHLNVSGYDLRVFDDGGPLIDFNSGNELDVDVYVVSESTPDDFGANSPVNADSPADLLFGGKVDVGNAGLPGLRTSQDTSLVISFSGLDPNKHYSFRGTASRGGGYEDRWAVYTLHSAEAFIEAHVDGSDNLNIITQVSFPESGLESNQVALNSGDNKAGSLVGWDNMEPGADGIIEIEAQQYAGEAPFGNPSAGPYGYGFTAIYLAEFDATGNLRITRNPSDAAIPAGQQVTLEVGAESPAAISYQWQSAEPGGAEFSDLDGATESVMESRILNVADSGRQYRCVISSGGNTAFSAVATITVDGSIPSLTSVVGSFNFNAVHLIFSEPMNLEALANKENYEISDGLEIHSAIVQDSMQVRILTSEQTSGSRYTVSVNNVADLAGNQIASNTSKRFTAFTVQTGAVGLEIWNNTAAGNTAPDDLQTDPRYPDSPDEEFVVTTFDSEEAFPNGPKNTYGARFRAWITPEESGDYEFFIQSDGGSELHIGMDDDFGPLDDLDRFPDALGAAGGVFNEDDDSYSLPVSLQAGKKYAIMAIWKESNGPDYCQVAWRNINDNTFVEDLEPIPSKFLSFYAPSSEPEPEEPASITSIDQQGSDIAISWTGQGLQTTVDFDTWAEIPNAANPYILTPDDEKRFFRAINLE